MKRELNIAEHRIIIYEPNSGNNYPILYMHANDEKETDKIWDLMNQTGFIFVCIQNVDWNKYMSPWPAKKVFKSEEDFEGKADDYIKTLTKIIVPEVENTVIFQTTARGLIGYSLSGLFALYVLYKTDVFTLIGSMSGSLWYENWIPYMRSNHIKIITPKVYLSLGDKEGKTKNEMMAKVEDCTKQAEDILRSNGSKVIFEMNPGNHFTDTAKRIAKGINWLI